MLSPLYKGGEKLYLVSGSTVLGVLSGFICFPISSVKADGLQILSGSIWSSFLPKTRWFGPLSGRLHTI